MAFVELDPQNMSGRHLGQLQNGKGPAQNGYHPRGEHLFSSGRLIRDHGTDFWDYNNIKLKKLKKSQSSKKIEKFEKLEKFEKN